MNKTLSNMYYVSLFLIGLPSIYLFFPIINVLNLAKFLWIILFFFVIVKIINGKQKLKINRTFLTLLLFFFITQSLSIINTINLSTFIARYKDFLFQSIFFIISIYFLRTKNDIEMIFKILIALIIINLLVQVLIVFNTPLFISMAGYLLHPVYFETILVNIERGRIFLTSYDEVFIPLVFYFLLAKESNIKKNILGTILIVSIVFFSLIVGFRTKILMFVFAIAGSLLLFGFKKNLIKLRFSLVLFFIFFSLYLLYAASPYLNIKTGFERILELGSDVKEVTTGRTVKWAKAYEIGLSSPFVGVGLGNYYDYLDYSMQKSFSISKSVQIQHQIAAQDAHNVFFSLFAETGILGLLSFILLLGYFVKTDRMAFNNKNKLAETFALSFWTLFIFSLLNPSTAIFYQTLFWLFRVSIERTINI